MSESSGTKLSASAKEWIPPVAAALPPPPPPQPPPPPPPPSTRFRFSTVALGNNHLQANCHTDGTYFADLINKFLSKGDFEEAKLQIERCRDSRIQETLQFPGCNFSHNVLIDLYFHLREAFEIPLSENVTLEYVKNDAIKYKQHYIVRSPVPVREAPWYGATKVMVTNDEIFLLESDTPANFLMATQLQSVNMPLILVQRAFGYLSIIRGAILTLPIDVIAKSCGQELLTTVKANYQRKLSALGINPLILYMAGGRKKVQKKRQTKRTKKRKIQTRRPRRR